VILLACLVAAGAAFTLSASAGLGGSLILVPALSPILGAKQGVALAALLLAANNVCKVALYRRTMPLAAGLRVALFSAAGAFLGAHLLLALPESVIAGAVVIGVGSALLFEARLLRARSGARPTRVEHLRRGASALLAFGSGATSGFSGTSGPLNGAAIRNLGLDRMHFVGAASLVSLSGDLVKTAVFARAELLDERAWTVLLCALPLMALGSLSGRELRASWESPPSSRCSGW
jgi:uncharacterized membrane protein YfcA